MRKISKLIAILLSLCFQVANSQNLIAVQNGGNPTFYTKLDSAIVHAVNGDTICIPGGNFLFNNSTIDKRLHIIGVGHHPDTTLATNPTNLILGDYLNILSGASGGSLIGIKLFGGFTEIKLGTTSPSGVNVTNYTVGSCYISSVELFYGAFNNLFYGNIINGPINNWNLNSFFNNIISGPISMGSGSIINNNVVTFGSGYQIVSTSSAIFENNIFVNYSSIMVNSGYNIFNNNLFEAPVYFPNGTNTGNNNISNQALSTIFIDYSNSGAFNYTQDYHLQPTCSGKNAGRDGTDIGIYGGAFPWKDGSIPFNPHFQAVQIAPTTDPSGNLNINIKVAAQDR